jgi:hypothetical protein
MTNSTVRFSTFPRTEPPPGFVEDVVAVFGQREGEITTETNDKGLKSDEVLAVLGPDLASIGFQVEASKKKVDKLERPVFFGENGVPTLRYEIDAYHPEWKCGLEVEAGRGWMGNAVYRVKGCATQPILEDLKPENDLPGTTLLAPGGSTSASV